jgi:hypothetical protein
LNIINLWVVGRKFGYYYKSLNKPLALNLQCKTVLRFLC